MKHFINFVAVAAWVFGIAFAKGFWLILFSFLVPPLAWVVLAHHVAERLGL